MANQKHPSGPPMDLANMRQQGVRGLAVYCLNPKCGHQTVLNVDTYPATTLVQSFGPKMVCAKCGVIGADARPNWKEAPSMPDHRGGRPAMPNGEE